MRTLGLVLAIAAGCSKPAPAIPPRSSSPAEIAAADAAFWRFVQGNVETIKQIHTAREPIADQLYERLHQVDRGLTFEVGGTEPFELVISADGDKKIFPTVRQLVAAAPPIPGLKIIAFRPRRDPDFTLRLDDRTLSAGDLWFVAAHDERQGMIALTIYVRGLTPQNEVGVKQAAFLLLDSLLGEYDIETRVGGIEWKPAPDQPAPPLRSIRELPATVDGWK